MVRFSLLIFWSNRSMGSSQRAAAQWTWNRAHFSTRPTETLSVSCCCVMSFRMPLVRSQMKWNLGTQRFGRVRNRLRIYQYGNKTDAKAPI